MFIHEARASLRTHHSYIFLQFPKSFSKFSSPSSQIIHLCKFGFLFDAIRLLNSTKSSDLCKIPSETPVLCACLVHACTKELSFKHGLQFHARVIKNGLESDRFVGNSLLALYFKLCPIFSDTRNLFDGLIYKDVVSWSSMISGYIRAKRPDLSIDMYMKMVEFGIEPNGFSLSAVIKACSELRKLRMGKCFHGTVIKCGFDISVVIAGALVDMYGRSYESADAWKVFDEVIEPDNVCWTSMISAYTRNDMYKEALDLFYLMHTTSGIFPDAFTYGSLLTSLGNLGFLSHGKQIHAKVLIGGLTKNVFTESCLVDMYAKCGLVSDSQLIFDYMEEKNEISWSALLGGYCQHGDYNTVIDLFKQMKGVNLYSFGTLLRACAGLSAVRLGKEIHCQYLRKQGWKDVIVESALLDLYARCGCIDSAYKVFVQMPMRNTITWNSMISGFAQNGRGMEAIQMFDDMIKYGIKPDYISFVVVLSACSHSGLVSQGRQYFMSMAESYKIKPGFEHYSCMIDLLGRAGEIEEAEKMIRNSDFRNNSYLWEALICSCSISTDSIVAERIAKKMMELKPDYHLSYVLLANLYRNVGRWDDALMVRYQMEDKKVQKLPGKSWIETNNGSVFINETC